MRTSASILLLGSLAAVVDALACSDVSSDPKDCIHPDPATTMSEGPPRGQNETYEGVTMYETGNSSSLAVLYVTDLLGLNSTDNLRFGRAGYLTVAPDLFHGEPAPRNLSQAGFNLTEFFATHGPEVTDPIIEKGIQYLKQKPGVTQIAIAGYCFGGRYALRFAGRGTVVAFAAHPSEYTDDEAKNIGVPTGVVAGQDDALMPAEKRYALEGLLAGQAHPWDLTVYSGAPHGFAVTANMSDPQQRFAKQDAFEQAVRWFQYWA